MEENEKQTEEEPIDPNVKWEILSPGCLSLVGTKVQIVHGGPSYPFHVHRGAVCYCACDCLGNAKKSALAVVSDLIQMGIDP